MRKFRHLDGGREIERHRDRERTTDTRRNKQADRESDTDTRRQRQTDKQRQKHVYGGKYLCYSLIFFGLNKTDRILDNPIPIMLVLFLP